MKLCFPEKILDQHLVVLGKTGAGKSSALRHIAEWLLGHKKRVCIVDPKGDWWGLKSSADGKSAGFPVITFGDFKEPKATDIPINPQSGKHVAELITSGNRPCIIGFRGWMPGQMTKFWLDFAPTLFNSAAGELFIIIDEVHNFAPKGKILDPDSGKCLHWTNRTLSEGRGLGMTFFIASQRPQKVHNDTLDCCETLVAMRINHPAARESVKDWIDGNGDKAHGLEVLKTLAQQERGEAWVWSPEIGFGPERVKFPMFQTFDSFAPPQLQKKVSQSGWAEVDLEAVKLKLSAVIEEAKANDPAELRKMISALRAELRTEQRKKVSSSPQLAVPNERLNQAESQIKKLKAAVEEAVKIIAQINAIGFDASVKPEEIKKAIEAASSQIVKLAESSLAERQRELERLKKEASRILYKLNALLEAKDGAINVEVNVKHNQPFTVAPTVKPDRAFQPINGNGDLSRSQMAILSALAQFEAIGRQAVSKKWVAALASASHTSSAFGNNLGTLRTNGYISYPTPGDVVLTDHGRKSAPQVDPPRDADEMLARCKQIISGSQARILDALHKAYPNELAKEQVAEFAEASVTSSAFGKNLGSLRSAGMIDYPTPGKVKLSSWVMLEVA